MTAEVNTPVSDEIVNRQFLAHLKTFVDCSKKSGVELAVVGGLPLEAYLHRPVKAKRTGSGAIRDIDALGIGPNRERIIDLNNSMQATLSMQANAPESAIEPLVFGLPEKRPFPIYLLTRIIVDNSSGQRKFYLQFGDVVQQIQSSTMDIVTINYGGVDFPTLRPETLAMRYFLRGPGGRLKPKDVSKVGELTGCLEQKEKFTFLEGEFDEYFDFMVAVAEKYGLHAWLFDAYWRTPLQNLANVKSANTIKTLLDHT